MLHLVQSSPRDSYARDRNKIINAACGLLGKEYRRPLDAIPDLLEFIKYRLVRRLMPAKRQAHTNRLERTVTICSRLVGGDYALALARELGHIRLHLYQFESLLPIHDVEADLYARTFLVPRRELAQQPAFQDLLSARHDGAALSPFVTELADFFGVTPACMMLELGEMGLLAADSLTAKVQALPGGEA